MSAIEPPTSATRAIAGDEATPEGERYLIFNADDFGASRGINRGIAAAHLDGVVTSTSLLVTGRALADAVELARQLPDLSIGLHWDVIGEDEREFDLVDHDAVRAEFARQLETFVAALGRMPTHVDSHRHLHMEPDAMPLFRELVAPLGVPLRGEPPVRFSNDFYGQPEWRQTDLERIGAPWLLALIEREAGPGWTEIGCHPGYVDPDFHSVYHAEREHELTTLTDARVARAIRDAGIRLAGHRELNERRLARSGDTA